MNVAQVTDKAETADERLLAHAERLSAARRGRSLDAFAKALASEDDLPVPEPVTEVVVRPHGVAPLLSAEAFELARKVYYLQHGTLTDAARAVVAAGLADVDDVVKVRDRLANWWARENWPKRDSAMTFALRDANFDGGVFRGRICRGITTGKGVAPAGAPCGQSALEDSEFCSQHDLRPEYVAARKKQAKRLLELRLADSVPLQPFVDWCTATRAELVEKAARCGLAIHGSDSGWARLADYLKVDKTTLWKLATKGVDRDGQTDVMVRASTIVRYLAALEDVSFEDLYGFAPPARRARSDATERCPECGGKKNAASETCKGCFLASATRCAYRNRRDEQCTSKTRHKSGYCYHCRRIVERVPRPRTGKKTFLTDAMLTLATGAYAETPTLADVGRRMWAANAEGVCDIFLNCRSLTAGLVKQFAKRGWSTPEVIAAAHEDLVQRHGEVSWPAGTPSVAAVSRTLPAGPFATWLQARYAETGTYAALSERIKLDATRISRLIGGTGAPAVTRATVENALEAWGDDTTLVDLYAEPGETR